MRPSPPTVRPSPLTPTIAEAHSNLGNALQDKGQLDEAIAAYRQAIALKPNYPEAYSNLGNALRDKGQLDEAIAAYRQAIALKPDYPEAHSNLGNALKDKGQLDEAIAAYRQAIALKPNYPEAHNNLGNALRDQGQLDAAIAAFRQAIALKPDYPEAYNNLGNALKDQGQLDEAIAAYRQAIALKPDYAEAHSNLLFALHFIPATTPRPWPRNPAAGTPACRAAEEVHPAPRQRPQPRPAPADRLCLAGFPGARRRPIPPAVAGARMTSSKFEIFCYAQVPRPDALTAAAAVAMPTVGEAPWGLSDEQVAELIRQDHIDILVDLTTAHGRQPPAGLRPQARPGAGDLAGYPGSTGLNTIDYRLSDPYLDPPGLDESVYSERTIRLPDSFWCYDPLDGREIPVNALPALTRASSPSAA